jgi:hypothetical protein
LTARQVAELEPLILQVAFVRAYQSGEMRPGAVPNEEHSTRIAPVVPGVVVDLADCPGDVPGLLLVRDRWIKSVVDADEHVALLVERLRLRLNARLRRTARLHRDSKSPRMVFAIAW